MNGTEFAKQFERHGFNFFTGVPCSLFGDTFSALENHPRRPYLPAVREDIAVGLAAGAWLGGREPAVLIQNSGLGTSLNALASLALMYKFPSLLVVTWRGFGDIDAPEHLLTGAITERLLELLGITHRTLSSETVSDDLAWATREMKERMEPVALLLPPKLLEPAEGSGVRGPGLRDLSEPRTPNPEPRLTSAPSLSRMEAMHHVLAELQDELVIHANGYICRESYAIKDRPENFYMIGSMGLASAIGLGLATVSDRKVIIFDGDGNLLMSLGILAMIGSRQPKNFVHVVFDNEVYGSTGNQRSVSRDVRLDHLARSAGYHRSLMVTEAEALREAARQALGEDGPTFLLVKVNADEAPVPRIPYSPEAIRDRFLKAVKVQA